MSTRLQRIAAFILILTLILLLPLGGPAAAQQPQALPSITLSARTAAVDRALTWLLAQQQADGSFPAGAGSAASMTIEALLAGAAAGRDVSTWRSGAGRPTALAYLAGRVSAYATDGGTAGKLLAGVVAAGADPRTFGGSDLVALVLSYHNGAGTLANTALGQAWAMLGLLAAREPLPAGAVNVLLGLQKADGGWEGGPGWGTDSNTTALALQALLAAGTALDHSAILKGIDYLAAQQSPTGGFAYSSVWGTAADANSTAYSLQALIALQQNPLDPAWLKGGRSALHDLLSFQLASGAFEWQPGNGANLLATAQAIPALLGKPLPLPGVVPAVQDALAYLHTQQQADGSFPGGFGTNLSPSTFALLALAGSSPRTWKGAGGASLIDYLTSQTHALTDAGIAGRLVTALVAARENPYSLAGTNVVARLKSFYDADTGSYDPYGNLWNHTLALWGLAAAGELLPAQAVTWLKNEQNPDGGWGWATDQPSDTNTTGVVLQALLSAGVAKNDPIITKALTYLRQQQTPDGGFAYDSSYGTLSDANSTAYALQGVLAAGVDPMLGWDWARTLTGTNQISITVNKPADRLFALQLPDGAFEWQTGEGANLLATLQAIPALQRVTFPRTSATLAAAKSAIAWLKTQQRDDGSFPASFGEPAGISLDVALAALALGEDLSTWRKAADKPSLLDYLAGAADAYVTDASKAGKYLVVAAAARQNLRRFGCVDLLQRLLSFDNGSGAFSNSATGQAWAILGLAAGNIPIRPAIVTTLVNLQQADGGWEGGPGWGTDSNTTALALQALAAAGVAADAQALTKARDYLKAQQSPTGGFAYSSTFGTTADANSTAYGIQGVLALDQDPAADAWQVNGKSPLDNLLAFQLANGAFEWQPGNGANLLATAQAVPALLYETCPLVVVYANSTWLPLIYSKSAGR